jgi:hypothetical protein
VSALIQATDGTTWDAEKDANPDVHGNESRNTFKWNCYHHWLGKFFQGPVKNAILRAINAVYAGKSYSFEGDYLILQQALHDSIRVRINEDPTRKQPFMFKIADLLVYAAQNEAFIERLQNNKLFRTSINYAHKGIQKYDSEAFVYDDIRLQKISSFLTLEICKNWQDNIYLQKCADIAIFLMKEDIYYRPRWIQIVQDIQPIVKQLKLDSVFFMGLYKLCNLCEDFEFTPEELENIERWH